ncbi:hypothetical protein [Vibrio intestinalis]|uniref:hypothetical protein n=1 Tax=Vibrio intestinalis TaxID=2933291 RepID=UPI0021A2ED41|nr:hypothetical protein [Vibrio intestinalis]
MDALDLINKLNLILMTAKQEAESFVESSGLPYTERFEASRSVEVASLRSQIKQFAFDLEALDEAGR